MKKLKILLVDPPLQLFTDYYRFYFPCGLASIAAVLENDGHSVRIADLEHLSNLTSKTFVENSDTHTDLLKTTDSHPIWEEYKIILEQFKPDVVGISVLTPKVIFSNKIANITKAINSNIKVIVGGSHVTARPQDLLKNKNVDFVVRGEGEVIMTNLVNAFASQKIDEFKIKGISYLNNDVMVNNMDEPLIKDLNLLPYPSRESLFNLEEYRPVDMGMMNTSRGCGYCCTFCDIPVQWRGKVRGRSVDNILGEMEYVIKKYGTTYFSFRDPTFTYSKSRTLKLCQGIKENFPTIEWECLTKPSCLSKDLVAEMISAGCVKIRIGVESGSPEIIEYMDKGATIDDVINTANILNNADMDWSAYFMLGVPLETEKSMDDTLSFMKEINPPFISLTKFVPMPGTKMFEDVIRAGLIDPENTDWLWSLNQSLDEAFTINISPDIFKKKMKHIAEYVAEHNRNRGLKDKRLKLN